MKLRPLTSRLAVCAILAGLNLAQPATAQKSNTATTAEVSPKRKARKAYKGVIEAIDASARTVTVKKATTTKTFKIADDVKCVTTFDSNAALTDLKPGVRVNVRFSDDSEMPVAHYIAYAAEKKAGADGQ